MGSSVNELMKEWDDSVKNYVRNDAYKIPLNKLNKISECIVKYFIVTGNRDWEEYTINPMYSSNYLDDEDVETVNFILSRLNYHLSRQYDRAMEGRYYE